MQEALARKENTAMVRAILYICNCQKSAVVNSGVDALAMGLIGVINDNSTPANAEEIALLFSMLMQKFGETQVYHIRIDYGLHGEEFRQVYDDWAKTVIAQRQNNAKLPIGYGLPMKSILRVAEGCASINDIVIDDSGKLMKQNPHEIAYLSNKPEDIEKAYRLQPVRPFDVENKFINRAIALAMNYTFIKDAKRMCQINNYGVLAYLIETVDEFRTEEMQTIGAYIANSLCSGRDIVANCIVLKLYEKKLKILTNAYDDTFLLAFINMDSYYLGKLLDSLETQNQTKPKHMNRTFCYSMVDRYSRNYFDSKEFLRLVRFWCNNDNNFVIAQICKDIIKEADDRQLQFYSENCREQIINIIAQLEKSDAVKQFDRVVAEIEYFPKYYSGYSKQELRWRAKPLQEKFNTAYNNLSETERSNNKNTYDATLAFLHKHL
jgi:hypothetical protein